MRRPGMALAGALLMLAAACSPAEEPAERGQPQTFKVQLDPRVEDLSVEMVAFFPNELAVRPGDTVQFEVQKTSGIPHTVTFGTLVDQAVEKIKGLGPNASFTQKEAELSKLTDPFPHSPPEGGPPKLNQSAGQPCYLESGEPPNSLAGGAPACDNKELPDFRGNASFYNSGVVVEDGADFDLKVADDAKPGTYTFICLVHRADMIGELTVVEKDRGVAEPAKVEAEAREQIKDTVSKLREAAEAAKQGGPDNAAAGAGAEGVAAIVTEFLPKEVSIPVGGSVKWNLLFFHTIAFNVDEDAVGVLVKGEDGTFELNPKVRPINSDPPPAEYQFFPPRTDKPLAMNGGRFVGSGSKSSGVLASVPPAFISYSVTFTEPGTYEVRCQLHPDMEGTVKVG